METTPPPAWTPRTNKELLKWAIENDKALMECNADKLAMKAYAETLRTEKEQ